MKILFIGATGMLGKPVAKELIGAGFDVTLLARDTPKTQALFPGNKVREGDVLNRESLRTAMTGMDAVYCNLSVQQTSGKKDPQPEREGVDNILVTAKDTGIKRIAYLSSLVQRYEGMNNFHWWALQVKASAVQKIKESGIPYTIFYPSTFMETFPFQMMQGKKIAMLGTSVAPMWFIAAADYGQQVARSFQLLSNENKEYSIQGLESFTFGQAIKIVIENYSKGRLSSIKAPVGLIRFFANFIPRFRYAWRICEALNHYPEKFESERTWEELGKPVISLADYAKSL